MMRVQGSTLIVLVFSCLGMACSSWQQPMLAEKWVAAEACPDFSGSYSYPDAEQIAEACHRTSKIGFGDSDDRLVLPSLSDDLNGGYQRPVAGTEIQIEQSSCSEIRFNAQVHRFDSQVEWSGATSLVIKRMTTEVAWGDNSLRVRKRFRAAGFGAGMEANFWTFTLEKTDGNDLIYSFRHDRGQSGQRYYDVTCRLERGRPR